jgi:arylsulfatase A-like enzyme
MKVLVISADALQAGFVGAYGNEWIATPTLDRLAAEGIVFDRHYADRPDAEGARHAWRTGCHHLPEPGPAAAEAVPPNLIDLLNRQGVHTALVLDDSRDTPSAFAQGWQTVRRSQAQADEKGSPLDQALESVVQTIEELPAASPWLLWLDLATLLPPWEVPGNYRELYFQEDADELSDEDEAEDDGNEDADEEHALTPWTQALPPRIDADDAAAFLRLQRTYAGAVTYLDAGLGLLLDELAERRLLDDLAILVTTDRGQPLGEHGVVAADVPWLHEERVHLPLVIRLPGAAEAGRRVAALTQPVDLFPTLLDLFGLPVPAVHGHSLLPFCRGPAEPVRAYACSGLQVGGAIEWALRTREWAFLLPVFPLEENPARGPQLYVKPDDRWEVNNIIQHYLEWAQHLEQTSRGFVEAARRPGALQPPELRTFEAVQQEVPATPEDNPESGDQA